MKSQNNQAIVFDRAQNLRLDSFLVDELASYSRSYWNNMIKHGFIEVNQKKTSKSGLKLHSGDIVQVSWPEVTRTYFNKVKSIYTDDNVIVIDKPSGMLTHSKGDFNPEYTVSDYLIERGVNFDSKSNRTGIVHRLDRNTSGVMIMARNNAALSYLQQQFSARTVKKTYIAVCEGGIKDRQLTIELPLARSKQNPKTFTVSEHGKEAITEVQVISKHHGTSLLAIYPKTGRTHQIRSHLSSIGHPIIGDTSYGAQKSLTSGRFLLHAYILSIKLPGNIQKSFVAEVPVDMSSYINEQDEKTLIKLKNSATVKE